MTWTPDTMVASTKHGPKPIPVMRLGTLAAHCMFADDGSGLDPANGYCVSLFDRGLRMSYGHRTWRDLGAAMIFAEALQRTRYDWSQWFATRFVPDALARVFSEKQEALAWLLKPGVAIRAASP